MTLLLCVVAYLALVLAIAYQALYSKSLPGTRTPPWRRAPTQAMSTPDDEPESLVSELRRRQKAGEPVDIEDVTYDRFVRRLEAQEAKLRRGPAEPAEHTTQ